MVEGVVEFAAKLKPEVFAQREILGGGDIPVVHAGLAKPGSGGVADGAHRRSAKDLRAEVSHKGAFAIRQRRVTGDHDAGAVRRSAGDIYRSGCGPADARGTSSDETGAARNSPIVDDEIQCLSADWDLGQVPNPVELEHVRAIDIRNRVEPAGRQLAGDGSRVLVGALTVIHCFGPCPGGAQLNAAGKAPVGVELQRVVIRGGIVLDARDVAQAGVASEK